MNNELKFLTSEDLARYRMVAAREYSIQMKPGGFSVPEIEQSFLERQKTLQNLAQEYDIDPREEWFVNSTTGLIGYTRDVE